MQMKKKCVKCIFSLTLMLVMLLPLFHTSGSAVQSDWVLPSQVPAGAEITATSYSYRESTESQSSSMSGWTQNGSYWRQSGTGSKQYASFPSTYKTSHATYTELNGSAYSAYENESSRRVVSNSHAGYVYWHWAYNVAYANNTNRWISDRKQTAGSSRNLSDYAYSYFYAFKSTTDAPRLSDFTYTWGANAKYNSGAVTYNCAGCLPAGADKSATSGLATPRFLRLDYYTSSYTDYQKIYRYYRDLQYQTTDPGNGSNISNKVKYVRYLMDFTVTYHANGGTGAPESQTKPMDTPVSLTWATPTRSDSSAGSYVITLDPNGGSVGTTRLTAPRTTSYTFSHWNTQQNGNGTSYNSGELYTDNASITLYAQWNSNTKTASVTLPTPTRTNFNFQGWAVSSTASSGVKGTYTPNGNVTLHAVWTTSRFFDVAHDAYSFGNSMSAFGYTSLGPGASYPIKYAPAFKLLYGDSVAGKLKYRQAILSPWGGNCCGMSSSAALMFAGGSPSPASFGSGDAYSLSVGDSNGEFSVLTFVEAMQVAQYSEQFADEYKNNRVYKYQIEAGDQKLTALNAAVSSAVSSGNGAIIAIGKSGVGAHALFAYRMETVSDSERRMYVYDCNFPGDERYFTLYVDGQGTVYGWTYDMGGYGIWGTEGADGYSCFISYIPYETIDYIWTHRGNLTENKEMLSFSGDNLSIRDYSGTEIAAIVNGQLETDRSDIYEVPELSMGWNATRCIFLPKDFYTIESTDGADMDLCMVDANLGASINTSAGAVSFAVDNSTRENTVIVENASPNDTYSVTLESSFAGVKYENVVVSGTGRGESISISGDSDTLTILNCNVTSLQINGTERISYTIASYSGPGGTISPRGDILVDSYSNKTFTIVPDAGYAIDSVKIDGIDMGDISEYEFENIIRDHSIAVLFKQVYGVTDASFDRRTNTVHADIINATNVRMACAIYDQSGRMLDVATVNLAKDCGSVSVQMSDGVLPSQITVKLFFLDSHWRPLCADYSFSD